MLSEKKGDESVLVLEERLCIRVLFFIFSASLFLASIYEISNANYMFVFGVVFSAYVFVDLLRKGRVCAVADESGIWLRSHKENKIEWDAVREVYCGSGVDNYIVVSLKNGNSFIQRLSYGPYKMAEVEYFCDFCEKIVVERGV